MGHKEKKINDELIINMRKNWLKVSAEKSLVKYLLFSGTFLNGTLLQDLLWGIHGKSITGNGELNGEQ